MDYTKNNLENQSSPYLLQHKNNPIWWQSWSSEVLDYAKVNNKPILVSIGYSACHWCHVMEKECFEDPEVADFMNRHFVSIKVDREERPDVDAAYMSAVQAINGNGGWPLNCFTLPDQRPIYGGTYFPKPNWMQILRSLVDLIENNKTKAEDYAKNLVLRIKESNQILQTQEQKFLDKNQLEKLIKSWKGSFDTNWGGFNRAPKFMLPICWDFLLAYAFVENREDILAQIKTTLDRMSWGGLYDQLRGGFSRYSVDMYWKIPHFEKMLYDNAQLISLYSKAFLIFKDNQYKKVVEETINWLDAELMSSSGAYFSALDADSEGEEGKFYVWENKELKSLLKQDYVLFSSYYSTEGFGKWEHEKSVLIRLKSDKDFCQEHRISLQDLESKKIEWKKILLEKRNKRIKPGLDNKILTSWNAMLVSALCDAYRSFENINYKAKAEKVLQCILAKYSKGKLPRTLNNPNDFINGFLDDYAFTIKACIDFYQISFDDSYLLKAKEIVDFVLSEFQSEGSLLFEYSLDKDLYLKSKEISDSVIPSSNALMVENLLKMYQFFADKSYWYRAKNMLIFMHKPMQQYPQGYSLWLKCSFMLLEGLSELALNVSKLREDSTLRKIYQKISPFTIIAQTKENSKIPLLYGKHSPDKQLYYLCKNQICKQITDEIDLILKDL